MINHETDIIVKKSKRGRKPKIKPDTENDKNEPKIPKKRGRKPKNKIYSSETTSNKINSDNVILHLPIKKKNHIDSKETEFLTYNPDISIPQPSETDGLGHLFDNVHFLDNKDIFQYNKNELLEDYTVIDNTTVNNLKDNEIDNNLNENLNDNNNISDNYISDNYISDNSISDNISDTVNNTNNNVKNDNDNINSNDNDIIIKVNHVDNWFIEKNNSLNNSHQEMIESIKKKRESDIQTDNLDQETVRANYFLNHFKNGWPQSTSIHCWWCCHSFKGCPCAIPKEYNDNKFITYGIFCSPECATSYNFNQGINEWEQYTLLNLLYKKLYKDENIQIKLAADRKLLNIFGGTLNIKEFRKLNLNYNKSFKIIEPPMISIVPIQEFNFIDNGYSSKEYSNEVKIFKKNINKLKLQRSKPVHNQSNTLENFMNINLTN